MKSDQRKTLKVIADQLGSYYKLARHLGVTPSTVYRWRDGTTEIPRPVEILIEGYILHPHRIVEDKSK